MSNTANLTVTAATPTIAKAFAPASIAADGTSTITFTLANTNGIALTGAGFTDTLANMAINAAGAAGGTCAGAATNTSPRRRRRSPSPASRSRPTAIAR